MTLDARSEKALAGVHPKLVAVVRRADELLERAGDVTFTVTEGLRSKTRQKQLVAAGASRTMNSRHLTGHAVDLAAKVGGGIRWDWPLYAKLSEAMKSAAAEQGTVITWGGDWKSFKDGPHFELDPKAYPL
jgi:peptidoglycan L-alanyl-D-glutamate endopeptidase CwlK